MWIPGFIMIWFPSILVFISLSMTALGQRKEILDSIRATYENGAEIKERYMKLQHELNEPGKIQPCESNKPRLYNRENGTIIEFNIKSEITTGDMGQETGFLLIMDFSTTIDIPAIIKCIPTADKPILYDNKILIYYLVLHGAENDTKFELAHPTEEVKDNKRVFVLHEAQAFSKIMKTYKKRFNNAAKSWFKDSKNYVKGIESCKNFIYEGYVNFDIAVSKWEVAESNFITGTHKLRIAKDFEVNIRGYVECVYNILDPEEEPKKILSTERLYFTILDQNKELKPIEFIQIFGPKNLGSKKNESKIFATAIRLL